MGFAEGRTAGLSPVAFGILWTAGGLGASDVSESQGDGIVMAISLENGTKTSLPLPPPYPSPVL